MIDVLGNFQKNKLTFITAGFSVFTFLRDIEDMITHFFSNLKYLLIAFGFLLIVLIYNSLRRKTMFKDSYKESEDSPPVFQHINGRSNSIKKISFKIAIVFCTAFFIFGLLSLSYVKNYPIYYIKVKTFKSEAEAVDFMNKINISFNKNSENNIKARCLKRSTNPNKYLDGNYMVTLNGGYLSKNAALKKLNKANIILNNKYNLTVTNPTRNISVKKKIMYLMENN
jgi:hypothetical protein